MRNQSNFNIGVIGSSLLENEQRIPIYPEHLDWIPQDLRKNISFEESYGSHFFLSDRILAHKGFSVASREKILANSDVVILPKPTEEDLLKMKNGGILWGWAHCVQQYHITSAAIKKKLTLLTWESMFQWTPSGEKSTHIFYRNNELAGYAGVIHALSLAGIDGYYGPRRKVCVMSYGSVSKGSIYALNRHGFNNITVFTQRPSHLVADKNPDVYYASMYKNNDGKMIARFEDRREELLIDAIKDSDVIVNGILQDPNNPILYISNDQVKDLKQGQIIIDISCDEGMGFSFAVPTTFENPIIKINDRILYYSVDHTPSYLWNAASRELSKALLPYLSEVMSGVHQIKQNKILNNAIEIEHGVIKNGAILKFQRRSEHYPHEYI
jgi:alanine dehydrogenase